MQLTLLATFLPLAASLLSCTPVTPAPGMTDWCNANCNAAPPFCLSQLCTCVTVPAASGTPTRSRTSAASQSRTISLTPSQTPTGTVAPSQTRTRTAVPTSSPTQTGTPFPLGVDFQAFTSSDCSSNQIASAVRANGECFALGNLFISIRRSGSLVLAEIFQSSTCALSSRVDTEVTACNANCEPHNIETLGQVFWSFTCVEPTSTASATATAAPSDSASTTSAPSSSRTQTAAPTSSRSTTSAASASRTPSSSPTTSPLSGAIQYTIDVFENDGSQTAQAVCGGAATFSDTALVGECRPAGGVFVRATGSSTNIQAAFFSDASCSQASQIDLQVTSCNANCERHFVTGLGLNGGLGDVFWTVSCSQASASPTPAPLPELSPNTFGVIVHTGSCDGDITFFDIGNFGECRQVDTTVFYKATRPAQDNSLTVEFFSGTSCETQFRVDSEVTRCGARCETHFVALGSTTAVDTQIWDIACGPLA